VNWFGYDTDCHIINGLWVHPIDFFFDILSHDIQINVLRIPFGYDTIQQWENPPKYECVTANPWMNDMSIKDTFHVLFQKARERSIAIVLDFHSLNNVITDYLVSDEMTIDATFEMWKKIMFEFQQYDNFLAIDIKNEPHGSIDWYEWGSYVSSIVTFIQTICPEYRGLFFVEGIEDKASKSVWGGSFSQLQKSMMHIFPNQKIVFSPHIYGYSIRGDIANDDTYALFDYWFGNLRFKFPNNAIVIGEIGGMNIGNDFAWHTKIKNYLKKRNLRDVIYWCLNPNSYDTGGIMEYDWTTIDYSKVEFNRDLQPNITLIQYVLPPPSSS
jgi:endoglucanase